MVSDHKTTQGSLGTVERRRYMPSPAANTAAVLIHCYRGTGSTRIEKLTSQAASDTYLAPKLRESPDNGKSWGDWRTVPDNDLRQGHIYMALHELGRYHDPACGKLFRLTLQRLFIGDPEDILRNAFRTGNHGGYRDHAIYQISEDEGETWGPMRLIKYEDGPEFNPAEWGNADYLNRNQMYSGYNAIAVSDGALLYSACATVNCQQEDICEVVCGVKVFKGVFNAAENRYDWRTPSLLTVPKRISSRGLMEPWLSALSDGRTYLGMRGSNSEFTPGRHWHSVSKDNGETWAPITDLRYDTGEQFYSPSSFAKTLRSAKTGKLYWFGNIVPEPSQGNWPRHPLVIAEIDETQIAIRKSTVTTIDGYEPDGDAGPFMQLSNFSLLENRDSKDIELYLTRYGEAGAFKEKSYYQAAVFKYVITLAK